MANITSFLNTIKNAIYGRDMRSALHDSIKAINDELEEEIERSTSKDGSHDNSIAGLNTKLAQEIDTRSSTDVTLTSRIGTEESTRSLADEALSRRIDEEVLNRSEADTTIRQSISDEVTARTNADNAIDGRLKIVEAKAHTHENKGILDTIDADRIRKWDDGSQGAVTLEDYLEHLRDSEQQFKMIWELIGLNIYDGGWFGMAQLDVPLDGGSFDDTVFTPVDCGDFGKFVPSGGGIADVVDGGTY